MCAEFQIRDRNKHKHFTQPNRQHKRTAMQSGSNWCERVNVWFSNVRNVYENDCLWCIWLKYLSLVMGSYSSYMSEFCGLRVGGTGETRAWKAFWQNLNKLINKMSVTLIAAVQDVSCFWLRQRCDLGLNLFWGVGDRGAYPCPVCFHVNLCRWKFCVGPTHLLEVPEYIWKGSVFQDFILNPEIRDSNL